VDRRDLLKVAGGTLLAGTSCGYAVRLLTTARAGVPGEGSPLSGKKMGMVVDVGKCVEGCTACMDACRAENNVAHHENRELDVYWIRKVTIRKKPDAAAAETLDERKHVILLCNHCDNPPCAQVCPVRATFKREDGIVIVDHHRCIGCRYCMIACPYNARYFNYKENEDWPNKEYPKRSHGVPEACNFCAHLVDQGMMPACVDACEEGALVFGNLDDPESEISRVIAENSVKRIREDWGTEPKVYYIGL